jgi:FtsZ-binding cell division protein ZapB
MLRETQVYPDRGEEMNLEVMRKDFGDIAQEELSKAGLAWVSPIMGLAEAAVEQAGLLENIKKLAMSLDDEQSDWEEKLGKIARENDDLRMIIDNWHDEHETLRRKIEDIESDYKESIVALESENLVLQKENVAFAKRLDALEDAVTSPAPITITASGAGISLISSSVPASSVNMLSEGQQERILSHLPSLQKCKHSIPLMNWMFKQGKSFVMTDARRQEVNELLKVHPSVSGQVFLLFKDMCITDQKQVKSGSRLLMKITFKPDNVYAYKGETPTDRKRRLAGTRGPRKGNDDEGGTTVVAGKGIKKPNGSGDAA